MHTKKVKHKEMLVAPPISSKLKSGHVVLHQGQDVGEHVTEGKEEIIYIIAGKAIITVDDEVEKIESGTMIYIPHGKKHNIKNEDEETLQYIYVVSPL